MPMHNPPQDCNASLRLCLLVWFSMLFKGGNLVSSSKCFQPRHSSLFIERIINHVLINTFIYVLYTTVSITFCQHITNYKNFRTLSMSENTSYTSGRLCSISLAIFLVSVVVRITQIPCWRLTVVITPTYSYPSRIRLT